MGTSVKVMIFFKGATYIAGVFFLYALFSMMYLRQDYTLHMPQTEQIESGRIVPVKVNYNKIVYVTGAEKRKLDTRFYNFLAASMLVVLVLCVRSFVKQHM